MSIDVLETVSLKVTTNTDRFGQLSFTVNMPRSQFSDLGFLFANPGVSKVVRIKLLRDIIHTGLRDTLALVEALEAFYAREYESLRADDPEIADFRNNHGQDD